MTKKKKIILSIVGIVLLLITQFISFLFYVQYSTVYFGYEGDQFIERIGGPYHIPLIIMIIAGIGIIILIVYLIKLSKKK